MGPRQDLTEARRWRELARELGGVIGRSHRPICFLLGAGASLSSGGPTTKQVAEAFAGATGARFQGLDLMRMIQTLPEHEKQDILAPLFSDVRPGPGYLSLAALAKHRRIIVLNLNWDDALAQACSRQAVVCRQFDIASPPGTWPPDIDASPDPCLYDVHIHGILGVECRYGTLETLLFAREAENYLVKNGLQNTMVCIGAYLNNENDLPQLFQARMRAGDPVRPASQHWYFVRGDAVLGPEDRMRQTMTFASPVTYVRAPDIDFDHVATLLVDAALSIISKPGA